MDSDFNAMIGVSGRRGSRHSGRVEPDVVDRDMRVVPVGRANAQLGRRRCPSAAGRRREGRAERHITCRQRGLQDGVAASSSLLAQPNAVDRANRQRRALDTYWIASVAQSQRPTAAQHERANGRA